MPSKTPTRAAAAAAKTAAAAPPPAPSLADMIATAVAAALAAQGIAGHGPTAQAVEQIKDPVTGLPFVANPVRTDTPRGPAFVPRQDDRHFEGTVNDEVYPEINPETRKPFKCPPRIRQRFMQAASGGYSFALTLTVTDPTGKQVDHDLGDLEPRRYSKGNHGLAASQIKEAIIVGNTEYTLGGGINLTLGAYRLNG